MQELCYQNTFFSKQVLCASFFFLPSVALLMHDAIFILFFNYLINICVPVVLTVAIFYPALLLSRYTTARDNTHVNGIS